MKKAARPKGTRDFLPQEMRKRRQVIDAVRGVFERFGYEPMETPAIERWDVLKGKFGDEGEQLLFKILRRGGELDKLRLGQTDKVEFTDFDDVVDLALRYDLTVPFSRVLAMHADVVKPFKRYQIQPVWRADRPQKGRFREFYQCDVDVAGASSMLADAEILAIIYEVMTTLGFDQFRIRLNHRKLLNGLVASSGGSELFGPICVAIDKLDKIGEDGVRKELASRGVTEDIIDDLMGWVAIQGDFETLAGQLKERIGDHEEGNAGLDELTHLYEILGQLGVDTAKVPLDLSLIRGLDYYTGPIFETHVDEPAIGSLSGGGRYDTLIERFSGNAIPAVGGTIGLERIIVVMEELGMLDESPTGTQLLVIPPKPDSLGAALGFAQDMRKAGIVTEIFLKDNAKFKHQIKYAGTMGIPVIAILGADEIAAGEVKLRTSKENQIAVPLEEAPEHIRRLLDEIA